MKVILCGYNWIGCEVLTQLVNNSEVSDIYVYTHSSPAHIVDLFEYCHKIDVGVTIDKISVNNLPFIPDIICSIYYKYIIDISVIDKCKKKIFNIHPSILPDYKGCSSITWAMVNGEEKVGYTYHYIDKGVDTGNILFQEQILLQPFETQQSMYFRVMFDGAKGFNRAFNMVKEGNPGTEQPAGGEYYKRGAPHEGVINEEWGDERVERFIRAMNYPPMPYAKYKGDEVRKLSEYYLLKEA